MRSTRCVRAPACQRMLPKARRAAAAAGIVVLRAQFQEPLTSAIKRANIAPACDGALLPDCCEVPPAEAMRRMVEKSKLLSIMPRLDAEPRGAQLQSPELVQRRKRAQVRNKGLVQLVQIMHASEPPACPTTATGD